MQEKLTMRIKYFEGATKLKKISKGNWIDVYARKDVFVPVGERAMIPLGFALELPKGWEGHLAPRSSTFKSWGIIQTNSVGVVDDTYIGDNDEWHMPVYCLQGKELRKTSKEGLIKLIAEQYKKDSSDFDPKTLITQPDYVCIYDKNGAGYYLTTGGKRKDDVDSGVWIRKGDKIGQFRVMEVMPEVEFEEVEAFGNDDRGGFGTTGVK